MGACTQTPSMAIVTELVPGGSMNELIHSSVAILTATDIMRVAYQTALGIFVRSYN